MKKTETRLRVMEMAAEIAAEAAHNPNVVFMIEFQEELVERLFKKMIALIDEGSVKDRTAEESSAERIEEEEDLQST